MDAPLVRNNNTYNFTFLPLGPTWGIAGATRQVFFCQCCLQMHVVVLLRIFIKLSSSSANSLQFICILMRSAGIKSSATSARGKESQDKVMQRPSPARPATPGKLAARSEVPYAEIQWTICQDFTVGAAKEKLHYCTLYSIVYYKIMF